MKPKISTGYFTPQANRIRRASTSTPTRSESQDDLNLLNNANESFFEKLMSCPIKRQLILSLISSEKENINEFKRKQEEKRKQLNGSPITKVQKKHKCESPTALFRRRALEQLTRQSPVSEAASSTSTSSNERSRPSSCQSTSSACSSPIPFDKLLDGVIAFVEIRSKDNQDRSSGAKALLRSMGATVKEQFTNDVTHVVYKDGSFKTYQKAKLMKIHLVSVLWIEAVRSSNTRVPEKRFPALGTEAYDHNVSSLCSQMQKDYEEIIRDEVRRSLSSGTPLPSTKSLIDRRRTIMTPFPSTSSQLSQSLQSTQDKEVEEIISKTNHNQTSVTAVRTSDIISDDDSDLGPCINGSIVNKRKLMPGEEVIFNSLENLGSESNMELTDLVTDDNTESLLSVRMRKSDENKNVMEVVLTESETESLHIEESNVKNKNTSTDSIYDKMTPKLNSIGKNRNEDGFCVPDDSFSRRRTRQLRSSTKPMFKSPLKEKRDKSSKDAPLKILSKNSCNTLANVEGNNSSTSLSSLRLSSEQNNAGISTSTNMSSLKISSEVNRAEQDDLIKNAEISTSTNMSSLQMSTGNDNKQVKVSESSTMSALVISSDSSKDIENSTKGKRNISRQEKSFNSTDDRSFSPLNTNIMKEVLQVLVTPPPKDENVTKRRRGRLRKSMLTGDNLPVQNDEKEPQKTRTEQKPKKSLGARRKTMMPLHTDRKEVDHSPAKKTKPFCSPVEVKSDSEICTSKRVLRKKHKDDSLMTSDESQLSGSEKKRKLRKLYNPEESFGDDVSDEQEREHKRLEIEKHNSNKGVILNPAVSVENNILVTAKTKDFIEKNNINIQAILEKQLESEEDKAPGKRGRKKKTDTKPKINSDADEQRQLAEEFLNKKPEKSVRKPIAKSEGKIIKRRQSVRLTQSSRKTLKFNNSVSSEDEKKSPPNRRSTMEFQTMSQTNAKRKLKIDKSKQPTIVCTRLHKDDIQVFNQIVKKLGGFVIEDEVSERTTHLVAGEPKRTVNMLRAIARGCWVLKHEWLLKSLEERKWLPEEDYEETDFSPAVQKCRLQRQAFGPSFSMDLLKDCGSIYIARGTNPRCSDLRELVTMCKGKVVTIPRNAQVVIGEHVKYEGVKCVKETWLLDSIMFNKRMPYKKYIIASGHESPHV